MVKESIRYNIYKMLCYVILIMEIYIYMYNKLEERSFHDLICRFVFLSVFPFEKGNIW